MKPKVFLLTDEDFKVSNNHIVRIKHKGSVRSESIGAVLPDRQQGQRSHHHGPGQQHLSCRCNPPQGHHTVVGILEGGRLLTKCHPA